MPQDCPGFSPERWLPALRALAGLLRLAARDDMQRALATSEVSRAVGQGVGDLTYALDEAAENALACWFREQASAQALSLFSEDRGWLHLGPDGAGGVRQLPGFDHGGARLMIDPVDGTRNLMADLRSAWSVMSLCGPGAGEPRLVDVQVAMLAELPDSRAARYRVLGAERGAGAWIEERELASDHLVRRARLVNDGDDRVDHGYFSFFRYTPCMRPKLAQIEAQFFACIEQHEAADLRNCFDDQYISNGGQLVLLALGTYRLIADLRAHLATQFEVSVTTSKPYDCAGAILLAQEAGCVVQDSAGALLDFPLDGSTPVSFVGFANEATARRLGSHLRTALG